MDAQSYGALPVTRAMVHRRTRELAVQAGRDPLDVTHADYRRARGELTGEPDFDQQDRVLNAFTQTGRR